MDKLFEKLEKLKKLTGGKTATGTPAKSSQSSESPTKTGDNRHRMTEQEEDEELMINDADELSEDELITRFDASPWCKLQPSFRSLKIRINYL